MRKARLLALVIAATACAGAALLARDATQRADLIAPRPSQIVYDRNGAFLTQIGHVSARANGAKQIDFGYWPLETTPQRVAAATLALEDRRFFAHPGFDLRALARALWRNATERSHAQGASTIAMQVARMQRPAPRGLLNKLFEAAAGVAIIARNGHEATLNHYLRLAPYGLGSHGVAHAARFYFDRPVEDLSWAQAALLAAIPQSPSRMNITRESGIRRAVARAGRAIAQLEKQGALDSLQASMARSELAAMRPLPAKHRPQSPQLALRYENLAREGRIETASPFDPRIHATIDLGTQMEITRLARRYLGIFKNAGAQQVAVMALARDGNRVIADVGSSDYADPRAGAFDFTRVQRSPGSTLKPFIYALAFERGALRATDLLDDIPEGASGVSNADGQFLGALTPRQALANSRNVPATNLLRRVGLEENFDFLRQLGLHQLEAPAESFGVAMAIGALPTRLENLMRAYTALADDGVMSDLSFAREEHKSPARRVLSVDSARLITSFLSDPLARLPSFQRYGAMEFPFAVAVKTGTSQNYRDAWTLAYSRQFIVGVWIGRGDAGPMRNLSGAQSAARLAHAALVSLHGVKPGEIAADSFPAPPDRIATDFCHAEPGAPCAQIAKEWLTPQEKSALVGAPPTATQGAAPTEIGALTIATPEPDMHVWRNPEQPARLNRLALKLAAGARDAQIVWLVDGQAFAVAQADETVFWPMTPGAHHIQARLALAPVASRPVKVTIE